MSIQADPLKARGSDVAMLSDTLRRGGAALESVPHQIKQLLKDKTWQHFVTKRGKEVRHERFAGFVTTPPLDGLGARVETIRKLLVDDNEALSLFDGAIGLRQGERTDLSHIIREVEPKQGTSKDQALRKLRKDAPELHAEVIAGNLSAHAAMVRAGYRKRTVTVQADDAEAAARALRKYMKPDQLAELARLLAEG